MFSKLVMGLCAISMLSSACTTRNASQLRAENELTMLVGTYTTGNSKGIYTFRFNQETGETTPLEVTEVSNPSYLTLSSDNRFVYAVSEENDMAISSSVTLSCTRERYSFLTFFYSASSICCTFGSSPYCSSAARFRS